MGCRQAAGIATQLNLPPAQRYTMKKAIVTGGGGFVGLAVVKRLLTEGIEPLVIGRNKYPEVEKLGVRQIQGDIRNTDFVRQAFNGCDTAIHVAAKAGIWGPWDEYYSINVTGTKNVIAGCLANGIDTLVYTSTPSVVFSGKQLCGVNETTPYATNFLCHYAHTKVLAEKLVLGASSTDFKTCALRPHLVWGPGDPNLIPRLVDRGRQRLLKRVGNGGNMVDISYIDNVADAHFLAAKNLKKTATASGKAYFISQDEPVNLWGWINSLFHRLEIPEVDQTVGFRKAYTAGLLLESFHNLFNSKKEPLMTRFLAEQLAKSHWFSIENARRDLGFSPAVSTEEGMNRTIDWLQGDK